MKKAFKKVCENRGYKVVDNGVIFEVNDRVYELKYLDRYVVAFFRKYSDDLIGGWGRVQSQFFGDYKDNENQFKKYFGYFLDYIEKKYYLTEEYQRERVNLLYKIEKETCKRVKGNKDLEDFALKIYNLGLRDGQPFC